MSRRPGDGAPAPTGWIAGVDVGATQVKAVACGAAAGEILHRAVELSRDGELREGIPAWAWTARKFVREAGERLGAPAAVGIACPGLSARDHRSIAFMPGRLQGLEGLDWPLLLGHEGRCSVVNDAQAALLGEVWQGAARGMRDVILVTLGTGVGGAILSDGWLLHGHTHRAGHIGHISLDPEGRPDITRVPGSLEDEIGEASLPARSGGRFQRTEDLLRAAAAGDAQAAEIWKKSVRALGCGLSSLINVVDPEAILIGGGVAAAGPALTAPLQAVLDEVEWRPAGGAVRILLAELGEWAGAIGAAWFAHARQARAGRADRTGGAARENHRLVLPVEKEDR
jgi:glucokinase